jgi:hypothetical protein
MRTEYRRLPGSCHFTSGKPCRAHPLSERSLAEPAPDRNSSLRATRAWATSRLLLSSLPCPCMPALAGETGTAAPPCALVGPCSSAPLRSPARSGGTARGFWGEATRGTGVARQTGAREAAAGHTAAASGGAAECAGPAAFALTRSAAGTATSRPSFRRTSLRESPPPTGNRRAPETPASGSGTCPSPAASHSWPPAWVDSSSIPPEPPRRPARWRSGPPSGWPDRTPSLPHPPPCCRRSAQRPRRRWMRQPVTHRPQPRAAERRVPQPMRPAPHRRRAGRGIVRPMLTEIPRCPAQRWPASTPPALPG